jgi:ABC-type ATPase with predicted acetyltransferase domain
VRAITLDVTLPPEADPAAPSANERLTRKIFGLADGPAARVLFGRCEVPTDGITYITGASGAGKSCLLRSLVDAFPDAAAEPSELPPGTRVVDSLEGDLSKVIAWLGRFGLGEARVLVAPAARLSAGQKERLKLARLLWGKPKAVVCDEFLSCLDRLTARVVAYQFQKVAREQGTLCFVATAHDDLGDALFPTSRAAAS